MVSVKLDANVMKQTFSWCFCHQDQQYKAQPGINKKQYSCFLSSLLFNIKYITLYKHNISPHIKADLSIYTLPSKKVPSSKQSTSCSFSTSPPPLCTQTLPLIVAALPSHLLNGRSLPTSLGMSIQGKFIVCPYC